MSNEATGFARIIETLPKDLNVLDAGGGGLHGENTTDVLAKHFGTKNLTCVCWSDKEVATYQAIRAERKEPPVKVLSEDFYKMKIPDGVWDVVVTDMNIESNVMIDWSFDGIERIKNMLTDRGIWISYIMTTDQYGDPDVTPALIRAQAERWYGKFPFDNEDIGKALRRIPGMEVYAFEQEVRRPYITWVAMQKI